MSEKKTATVLASNGGADSTSVATAVESSAPAKNDALKSVLQMVALFSLWYGFNAGCESISFSLSLFFSFTHTHTLSH